jgi:phage terminase large subunit-like protein
MHKLEEEMCNYTGDPSQKSPNVLDAMVYAAQFLMLEANMKPLNSWQPNFR